MKRFGNGTFGTLLAVDGQPVCQAFLLGQEKAISIEDNKAVIRRWIEARNNSNLEAALACWADETHEWLTPAFNRFTAAFPDIHLMIDEIIAEGDKVVVRRPCTSG